MVVVVGLVALTVLAVVVIVVGRSDDTASLPSTTATTAPAAPGGPDDVPRLVRFLLPPVGALGADWLEFDRDDDPTTATHDASDPCPSGPVPQGQLIHAEEHHVVDGDIVETLSVTAGVADAGVAIPRLDDPTVRQCLVDGITSSAEQGLTVTSEDLAVPAVAGADVTGVRVRVTDPAAGGAVKSVFDFVLVARGRAVSLGLLAGFQDTGGTPIAAVVTALDERVARVATVLG